MKARLLALLTCLTLLCACQPRLTILHLNDTHSHLEPVRGGKYDGHAGVIERAAIIDSIRGARGENRVLLVHAGDFVQGTSYYTELEGEVEINVMNALRYDVITLGNHEFDNGIEHLESMLSRLESTKVVCSNLDLSSFGLGRYVEPYVVIKKGGMKLGFVGLTSNLLSNVSRTISSRIPQLDNVEVVNKWAKYLKEDLSCDLVILLSHAGDAADRRLLPKTSDVDMIISGHSHTFMDDFEYLSNAQGRKIPIISDGEWGYQIGEICIR